MARNFGLSHIKTKKSLLDKLQGIKMRYRTDTFGDSNMDEVDKYSAEYHPKPDKDILHAGAITNSTIDISYPNGYKPVETVHFITKREDVLTPVGGFNVQNAVIKDMVNSPSHYKHNRHGIECIDAIRAALTDEEFRGYVKGNAIKYIWREKYKGHSKQDAEKARWYLDKLIDLLGE